MVSFHIHPSSQPKEGEKKNMCQQENVSGFYTDRHSHWAANSLWQLCLDQRCRGELVRLGFLLLCAWSQFRVLQKMLLFIRNCGRKEICCQVCPYPSSEMQSRKGSIWLGLYLVLVKVDQSLHFWWTPKRYQTQYSDASLFPIIILPFPQSQPMNSRLLW